MKPGLAALIIVEIALLVAGQILFQVAAHAVPSLAEVSGMLGLLTAWPVYAAGATYGAAAILWIGLLQRLPLSYAYPLLSVVFIIVPSLSLWQQGQWPSIQFLLGLVLVVISLGLIGSAIQRKD